MRALSDVSSPRSRGTELRSFIYVDDVVKAVLAAVDLSMDVGVINIVGGRVMSIRELLDQLIAISGKQIEIVVKKNSGPKRDYVFDNTKLVTYLLPQEVDFLYGLRMEYEHIARLR